MLPLEVAGVKLLLLQVINQRSPELSELKPHLVFFNTVDNEPLQSMPEDFKWFNCIRRVFCDQHLLFGVLNVFWANEKKKVKY